MEWRKGGLIFSPDGRFAWANNSALQPTPILLHAGVIRIYVGFRDKHGVGRVGYVDVESRNPSRVLGYSEQPALDIGIPGAFDDNGVVPCAVVQRSEGLFLYYAGYQRATKVEFLAFGGLAISTDGGHSFTRYSRVPVLERNNDEIYFRAAHCVLFDDNVWKVWYAAGSEFVMAGGKMRPKYDTRYIESADGIHFGPRGRICLSPRGDEADGEYRVGRSSVIKRGGQYRMFYSWGTAEGGLKIGFAVSSDGINWTRRDEDVGIDVSSEGWDSKNVSYPYVIEVGDRVYMFYNGNDYGHTGFGYAELVSW